MIQRRAHRIRPPQRLLHALPTEPTPPLVPLIDLMRRDGLSSRTGQPRSSKPISRSAFRSTTPLAEPLRVILAESLKVRGLIASFRTVLVPSIDWNESSSTPRALGLHFVDIPMVSPLSAFRRTEVRRHPSIADVDTAPLATPRHRTWRVVAKRPNSAGLRTPLPWIPRASPR